MHVAGVVVQTRPERGAAVRGRLEQIAGVEVHAAGADGRLVVTIEGDDRDAVAQALFQINALEGVLSACMAYERAEPELSTWRRRNQADQT